MLFLKSLLACLLFGASAVHSLKLQACTDNGCEDGCIDFTDAIQTGDCIDFGFTAGSIYMSGTTDDLDVWTPIRSGCLDGSGNEDAWLNPLSDGPCFDHTVSDDAKDGYRYALLSTNAE